MLRFADPDVRVLFVLDLFLRIRVFDSLVTSSQALSRQAYSHGSHFDYARRRNVNIVNSVIISTVYDAAQISTVLSNSRR